MASPGRPPGLPKVPGSGRKRGSLDKSARLLLTDRMAADILKVYKRLGPDWLFTVAKERPDLFINQCLSRLLPPAIKDDPDIQLNQQFNVSTMSDTEAARHVAFALAKALYPDPSLAPVETIEPMTQPACDWQPPVMPPLVHPEPELDPERVQWASELLLTDEQRRNAALVRETKEATLANYRGNTAEQSPVHHQGSGGGKASAAELCYRLSRRGRDLL